MASNPQYKYNNFCVAEKKIKIEKFQCKQVYSYLTLNPNAATREFGIRGKMMELRFYNR